LDLAMKKIAAMLMMPQLNFNSVRIMGLDQLIKIMKAEKI
jgi:hypothetical protein